MKAKPLTASFVTALAISASACSSEAPGPLGVSGGAAGVQAGGSGGASVVGSDPGLAGSAGVKGDAGMPSTIGAAGAGGLAGAPGTAGTAGSAGAPVMPAVCGDGTRAFGEACDDGNKESADGCSATCTVEAGYACATTCAPICGDKLKTGPETCDDGNDEPADGCSATCQLEAGWECKALGEPCTGICGDGILADELCDDKNKAPHDGCSASCVPEAGFVCDIPGSACRKAPVCSGGTCASTCGDGTVLAPEACDDGDTTPGDGCSATCTAEAGFTCVSMPAELPAQLAIPVTYRDFIRRPLAGATQHADQESFNGGDVTPKLVLPELGADGLPVYSGICELGSSNISSKLLCPFEEQTSTKANFDQWYRDVEGVNLTSPGVIVLGRQGQTENYVFDGGNLFTPLTGKGWDALGKEELSLGKNFSFTTELRYWFQFKGDEQLEFSGDDDVWVFINGKLAVDIGGLHPKQTRSVTLGAVKSAELGLTTGKVYEIALFHAERSPFESNFKLTFSGFVNDTSKCTKN